jgi:hypothetical protein
MRRLVALVLTLSAALGPAAAAQVQTAPKPAAWPADPKSLYREIAGDYLFEVAGETSILQFWEKEGTLYGAQQGGEDRTLVPVKDRPYRFEITVPSNGNHYQLEFIRDDKGVFTRCILTTADMVVEGVRQAKTPA